MRLYNYFFFIAFLVLSACSTNKHISTQADKTFVSRDTVNTETTAVTATDNTEQNSAVTETVTIIEEIAIPAGISGLDSAKAYADTSKSVLRRTVTYSVKSESGTRLEHIGSNVLTVSSAVTNTSASETQEITETKETKANGFYWLSAGFIIAIVIGIIVIVTFIILRRKFSLF